jgi:hypothetical protein
MSPDAMKQWAARYRLAALELTGQKRRELQALSNDEAARRADLLIESAHGAWMDPRRQVWSGLVEQQRLFRQLRPAPKVTE